MCPWGHSEGQSFREWCCWAGPWGDHKALVEPSWGQTEQWWAVPPPDHLWLLPAFPTDTDWRVNPDIPVSSPVTATWRISANPGGVPQEGPHLLHHTHNIVSPPSVNK